MKTFITSIFVQTNSLSAEKICVGLFAITPHQVHFAVSKKKLEYAAKLLPKELNTGLRKTFQKFDQKVVEFNSSPNQNNLVERFNYFSKEYFVYLNKYSSGLTQFTVPKPFAGEMNSAVFAELFQKFVGDDLYAPAMLKTENRHNTFKRYIQQTLELPAFKKTNTHYPVSPNVVKGIVADTSVDFICKNGSILVGNSLDFTQPVKAIERNVNEYALLAFALNKFSVQHGLPQSEYNLYCVMPESNTDQFTMFENTKNNLPFKMREQTELEATAQNIDNARVIPFTEYIKSIGIAG
ncbi:MAG: hypothetical protein V4615_05840 [Bacteroidota bacterium]